MKSFISFINSGSFCNSFNSAQISPFLDFITMKSGFEYINILAHKNYQEPKLNLGVKRMVCLKYSPYNKVIQG